MLACKSVPHYCAGVPPTCIPRGAVTAKTFTDAASSEHPSVATSNYWSSTTNASDTSNAWNVNFNNGNDNRNDKTNTNYVRCVRGGA